MVGFWDGDRFFWQRGEAVMEIKKKVAVDQAEAVSRQVAVLLMTQYLGREVEFPEVQM